MQKWWLLHCNKVRLCIVVLLFFGVFFVSNQTFAAPITSNGAVNVSGTVYGPPPIVPAIITSIASGQRFTNSPITVSGTCGPNLIVKIFKNNIFAGSAVCSNDGKFTILVDLLYGKTELRVRNYDFQDQAGPESMVLAVYYDVPSVTTEPANGNNSTVQAPSNNNEPSAANQLIIKTDVTHRGVTPNVDFEWPIEIVGGTPPYAVNISWGDGTTSLISRKDGSTFNLHHKYVKNGNYTITINVVDVLGRKTSIQLIALASTPLSAVRPQPITITKNYLQWIISVALLLIVGCVAYLIGRHKQGKKTSKSITN